MTDVTGVAIPRINENALKIREIPTPVVNRLGMTVLLFCAILLLRDSAIHFLTNFGLQTLQEKNARQITHLIGKLR